MNKRPSSECVPVSALSESGTDKQNVDASSGPSSALREYIERESASKDARIAELTALAERRQKDAERWQMLCDLIDDGVVYIERGHSAADSERVTVDMDAYIAKEAAKGESNG